MSLLIEILGAGTLLSEHDLIAKFNTFNTKLFDGKLPRVRMDIKNNTAATWLGRFIVSTKMNRRTGEILGSRKYMEFQKAIMNDETTLDKVLVHEMVHLWEHETFGADKDGDHGETFLKKAAEINKVMGKDFVTEKSDSSYNTSQKPFYLVAWPSDSNPSGMGFGYVPKPMTKAHKEKIANREGARYIETTDPKWLSKKPLSTGTSGYYKVRPEDQVELKKLYEEATVPDSSFPRPLKLSDFDKKRAASVVDDRMFSPEGRQARLDMLPGTESPLQQPPYYRFHALCPTLSKVLGDYGNNYGFMDGVEEIEERFSDLKDSHPDWSDKDILESMKKRSARQTTDWDWIREREEELKRHGKITIAENDNSGIIDDRYFEDDFRAMQEPVDQTYGWGLGKYPNLIKVIKSGKDDPLNKSYRSKKVGLQEPWQFEFEKDVSTDIQSTEKPIGHSDEAKAKNIIEQFSHRTGYFGDKLRMRVEMYFDNHHPMPDWIYTIKSSGKTSATLHAVYFQVGKQMIKIWDRGNIQSEYPWKRFEQQANMAGYKLSEYSKNKVEPAGGGYWLRKEN